MLDHLNKKELRGQLKMVDSFHRWGCLASGNSPSGGGPPLLESLWQIGPVMWNSSWTIFGPLAWIVRKSRLLYPFHSLRWPTRNCPSPETAWLVDPIPLTGWLTGTAFLKISRLLGRSAINRTDPVEQFPSLSQKTTSNRENSHWGCGGSSGTLLSATQGESALWDHVPETAQL